MDWFSIAQRDWTLYQDKTRIASYVAKGKITANQYKEITGEDYAA